MDARGKADGLAFVIDSVNTIVVDDELIVDRQPRPVVRSEVDLVLAFPLDAKLPLKAHAEVIGLADIDVEPDGTAALPRVQFGKVWQLLPVPLVVFERQT